MRVIPGVTADTHAHVLTGHAGSKFGLAPAAAAELIRRIERSPRLRMQGLHVHVGSQILDVEPFVQSVAPVAALGEFPVYDLGGGLGARYTYDDQPPAVGDYLDALIGAAREHLPAEAEVIIEPGPQHGRLRGGDALPRRHRQARRDHVRRRRRRHGRQPRGGAVRPALRGRHRRPARRRPAARRSPSSAATARAATCSSTASASTRPRVGDLLAVPATGAYCFTMANNYNGTRRIPVVFATDGAARLVVRRETWADLLARDIE